MSRSPGVVHLVGAGPGDPGLLTLRGRDALARADVVVYDQLANDRLLDWAPRSAERVFAGKVCGRPSITQAEINRLLVDHARAGRRVVRLKGGDPYVFGRGAEEAEYLHTEGIPFRVVPGVTAGVGVTSQAGLAVTHRSTSSAVAFVTGHDDPDAPRTPERPGLDWDSLAKFPGTLVVYMGLSRLGSICSALIRRGMDPATPAAVVSSGTMPTQRTIAGTLIDLAERVAQAGLIAPALLVVGKVVDHRGPLDWRGRLPLAGRRIVVTRPAEPDDRSAATLEDLGAEVLVAPTVAILPPLDPGPLDAALRRLDGFDWIVFTSAHGVDRTLDRLPALGLDLRALRRTSLAAIGRATTEALARYHLRADLTPETARSEDLADALIDRVRGRRVLLARADRGRQALPEALRGVADVVEVVAYRNADIEALPDEAARRLAEGSVDWITLTSPAIVERLHALLPEPARERIGRSIRLASLSPLTSESARRLGWEVAAEAVAASWDELVAAIVRVEGV